METPARRFTRVALILCLFLISIRYIYNPLSFILLWNQHYLFVISDFFDITGPDNIDFFDALFSLIVSSIISGALYFLLVKLYCFIRAYR